MNIKQLADNFVMNTYSRFPLTFVDAKDVYLYDENGKEYLDFTSGIAVNALGYGNEKLINAAKEQMEKFFHTSNLYYTEPMAKLAQKLVEKTCFDKVFSLRFELVIITKDTIATKNNTIKIHIISNNRLFNLD